MRLNELKVFTTWAKQQVQLSSREGVRFILDDVISTFSSYATRFEKSTSKEVRKTNERRLLVLVGLLDTPSVSSALRIVNWDWVRSWEKGLLDPVSVQRRCSMVFPTIITAGSLKTSKGASDLGITYLAKWCADFLQRGEICSFLESPVGIWDQPDMYSESTEEEVEDDILKSLPLSKVGPTILSSKQEGMQLRLKEVDGQEHCYADIEGNVRVRSATYLTDRVKEISKSAMLKLQAVELFISQESALHYLDRPWNIVQQLRNNGDKRFMVVLHFRMAPIYVVAIWAVPTDADWHDKPEGRLFKLFQESGDEERNRRFKIIPKVVDSPAWILSKALPEKPAIIPRKMDVAFFSFKDYLEMSVDVPSAPAAGHVVGLFKPAVRHLAIRVHVVIEGQRREELPERVLCGFQLNYADLCAAKQY